MPISHKSYIHQPIGYTAPVDLNLLGRVLQFKQAQFDAGVAKTQNSIDSVASLDVVKDVDKQYLNSKLNSLVNTINGIGGADFSDPNITNQIGGLSAQIYNDKNVINAVGTTKKLRYVQNYYKDLKEKKPKEWSASNERYDFKKFDQWLSDGQVGTTSNGGEVTPYAPYQEDHMKMFSKITGNMKTVFTDKGLMYRTDVHEYFTPDQVMASAAKLLTPQQKMQMGIDGRYEYEGVSVPDLLKAVDADKYQKIGVLKDKLDDYKAKQKGAVGLHDQERYEQLITKTENEIESQLAPVRKNADQMRETLYRNNYIQGLGERFGYERVKSTLQANSGEMFRLNYELNKKKFEYDQMNDALNREAGLAKEGMRMVADMFGNRTFVRDPSLVKPGTAAADKNPLDNLGLGSLDNSLEDQTIIFQKDILDTRKETILKDNEALKQEYIRRFAREKGLSDVIIEDMADGHLINKLDPETTKMFQQKMATWDAMTRGEKINYDELDPEFKEFASRYQENWGEIKGIDKFYLNIENQVAASKGIVGETREKVARYYQIQEQLKKLEDKYPLVAPAGSIDRNIYGLGRNIAVNNGVRAQQREYDAEKAALTIEQQALGLNTNLFKEYDKVRIPERNRLIGTASMRYNLPRVTASDNKEKDLAKMIVNTVIGSEAYDLSGNPLGKQALNVDGITPVDKGFALIKSADGRVIKVPTVKFEYSTGSGDKKKTQMMQVPLQPGQSQALGFGSEVRDVTGYNMALHLNGETDDIFTSSGRNYDLKYRILKVDEKNNNDPRVMIRVYKNSTPILLKPGPNYFPSYEQAMQFMETQTKFKTINEAFTSLEQFAKTSR